MSNLYRTRVCAIGSEEDIRVLLIRMLENFGVYEEPEDRSPYTRAELEAWVRREAGENGGPGDTFLYEMIAPLCYGDAEPGTCRLTVQEHASGRWTACFAYDSQHSFQPHEWLDLHNHAGRMLMTALRASDDFLLDKGEVIFTGGSVLDNWNQMTECWLFLIEQYECGLPPQDAVRHLKRLERILEEEEYDAGIEEILLSCKHLIQSLMMTEEDAAELKTAMAACMARGDFERLYEFEYAIVESVLWETEHHNKYLACLDTVLDAWKQEN